MPGCAGLPTHAVVPACLELQFATPGQAAAHRRIVGVAADVDHLLAAPIFVDGTGDAHPPIEVVLDDELLGRHVLGPRAIPVEGAIIGVGHAECLAVGGLQRGPEIRLVDQRDARAPVAVQVAGLVVAHADIQAPSIVETVFVSQIYAGRITCVAFLDTARAVDPPVRIGIVPTQVLAEIVAVFHAEHDGMTGEPLADEFLVHAPPFRPMFAPGIGSRIIDDALAFMGVMAEIKA